MLPFITLVTPCYPLFPIVTLCYPLLPLLPYVTPMLPLVTLVTLCYLLVILVTPCYLLLPLLPHDIQSSYLNSNFALTLGYLDPASNNPALVSNLGACHPDGGGLRI